jgi:hypothetical protein
MLVTFVEIHAQTNHLSFWFCSTMPSPHGGYYTFLLSKNYQYNWGNEDDADVEIEEVREVSPMTGMTSDSKMKGRSKNFSEDEDNLLVST